ncbi:MAG: phenylalanine--tRNA ligase subunit beta [Verrucomicrobiota bacterium]
MKLSLNWLSDHLDLSGCTTEEIADLLTFAGIEVEGIEQKGAPDKVIIAKILSSDQHPNADRLSVCKVEYGGEAPAQIVCGAKNYKVGDHVPLALPGATLPGDFTIKKGKLRGVESEGMMCSGRELEVSEDHEGLLILPAETTVGNPLSSIFPNDTVFELEVTPNRPDCLSHLGVARDLAAAMGAELKGPRDHAVNSIPRQPANETEIQVSAPEACPLYTARRIRGVKVTESPEWLKQRLLAIGLRPINNVVDITNYVLMEMGQPLHAFDVAKLDGGIHVRLAAEGEKFLALDGEEYTLADDDLLIADQSRGVAIAGVMGGEESGVTESTTDVLLESAYFDPPAVRRTSRKLGLVSDSSYRFERGVDPHQVAGASDLATKLILELAGGEADAAILVAGEAPTLTGEVVVDASKLGSLLGKKLTPKEIDGPLSSLGLEKTSTDDAPSTSTWCIPSFRLDLQRPVDLYEEVARLHGLENIPASSQGQFVDASSEDRSYDFDRTVSAKLVGQGFYECHTIKLIAERQFDDHLCPLIPGEPVALKNRLSDDHSHLRPGLLPGLLQVAERNVRQGAKSLKFVESGTIFIKTKGGKTLEKQHLALLMSGPASDPNWTNGAPGDASLSHLRGVLDTISPHPVSLIPLETNDELIVRAELKIGKQKIGLCGQLWPAKARSLDIDSPVLVAEIDLAKLEKLSTSDAVLYDELPRFPAITRDIAMEVDRSFANGDLVSFFEKHNQPLLVDFRMFDLFRDDTGEKLAADRKSIAYSLTYRSPERTLETAEVDDAHGKLLEALQKSLPITLR